MKAPELTEVLSEERRIMNLWAPSYDEAMLTNAFVYRREREEFADWVAATLREDGRQPAEVSVLDVGCGTGTVLEHLSRQGFTRLTGLDLAESMLAEARRRQLAGARWVTGSIEDSPLPPASFDAVLASFTIHHLRDPGAFFRLADRTLRPGGWFFILEYDGAAVRSGRSPWSRLARSGGDLARAAFARKNRRGLAARPRLERLFNPAHRLLSFTEIRAAMEGPCQYALRRRARGVLLPALLPVLLEESALDRALARWAGGLDRRLAPRTRGTFQWIAGRRVG